MFLNNVKVALKSKKQGVSVEWLKGATKERICNWVSLKVQCRVSLKNTLNGVSLNNEVKVSLKFFSIKTTTC